MANPFVLKAKRKLIENVAEGQIIEVTFKIFFAGLGEPGLRTITSRGAFVRDDGFNVVLVTQGRARKYIPISALQSVRPVA